MNFYTILKIFKFISKHNGVRLTNCFLNLKTKFTSIYFALTLFFLNWIRFCCVSIVEFFVSCFFFLKYKQFWQGQILNFRSQANYIINYFVLREVSSFVSRFRNTSAFLLLFSQKNSKKNTFFNLSLKCFLSTFSSIFQLNLHQTNQIHNSAKRNKYTKIISHHFLTKTFLR